MPVTITLNDGVGETASVALGQVMMQGGGVQATMGRVKMGGRRRRRRRRRRERERGERGRVEWQASRWEGRVASVKMGW